LTSSLGSIIPWLTSTGVPLLYSILLWLGVFVMLGGVVICSLAGHEREKALRTVGNQPIAGGFSSAVLICAASGVLSCFINLGFTYGVNVSRRAEVLGASPTSAPNLLWLIIMSGGFVSNAVYCGYLFLTKRSWRTYRHETAIYLGWALVMSILWVGSLVAYGVGANALGRLGSSVGWPVLMSLNIITSNVWGVVTGEWRGTSRRAIQTMTRGIATLLLAVMIFALASTKL
jgi:L-rhamnose-H+ transport protein